MKKILNIFNKQLFLSIIILNICYISSVYANTIGFLKKDRYGNYYRYEYNDLMDSAKDNVIGDEAPLYEDYCKYNLVAFEDDKNGYIDANAVMAEALEYSLDDNKVFNLDNYLEGKGKSHKIKEIKSIINVYEYNGQIIRENTKEELEFDVKRIY